MAYLVNKSDGTLLTTILDGQTDSISSSIVLIGKQVTNYGEIQNEDFIHILEHFSNSIDPANPLEGQLWWNNSAKVMKVFDGTSWRPVTGFTSSATAPVNSYVGDQWWDTTNDQYKVYSGSEWLIVGPAYSKIDGKSGAIVENVWDTLGNKHTLVNIYNNGNVTAVFSRDSTFTPNVAITGIATVHPGLTLSTAVDEIRVYGTATNAETLGNLTPGQYLRSDVDDETTGSLTVRGQLNVGDTQQTAVYANGLNDTIIENTSNAKVIVKVNGSTALTVNETGLVTVENNPVDTLGVVTKGYADNITSVLRNDVTNSTTGYLASNVATINATIAGVQANVTAANARISSLDTLKAPKENPFFTGIPQADTAPFGTNSTQLATTAFIQQAISAFDTTKIYVDSNNYVQVNPSNINIVSSGVIAATATSNGITTITQASNDNSTKIATTAFVKTAVKNFVRNGTPYQPTCYVSDQAPDNNVGTDGDFWFQYR